MTSPLNPMQRDNEIDLSEMLGTLRDNKWLIGRIVGFFVILGIIYALVATPIYQATSTAQVDQKVPELPGLTALTQTLGTESPETTTQAALITSRMVVGGVVDKLKLTTSSSAERIPLFGNFIARLYASRHPGQVAAPWFGMNGYDWGGSKLDIFQLSVPESLQDQPLTLVAGETGSDAFKKELITWVRKEIGPIATPDYIQWAAGLPKTRSGKIMRRILRKIGENQPDQLGDISTLADPGVVKSLVEERLIK